MTTRSILESLSTPNVFSRGEPAYARSGYAEALSEVGKPVPLEHSGGWLLERSIPGSYARDAMGCYPLFCCRDWSGLATDLEQLAASAVTVSLVADPFGPFGERELDTIFDFVRPLKDHYVVDLSRPVATVASRHHRYSARRAAESVSVSLSEQPSEHLDEWLRLYSTLCRRRRLRGVHVFSRESFRGQLGLAGTMLFTASVNGKMVAAHWFFVDGEVAYSHLAASDDTGYRLGASYALQWAAIEHLSGVAHWLDLGGAAGLGDHANDGLARFKRGWATHSVPAHLCGKILDPHRYADLTGSRDSSDYFPAYRRGEFA